MIDEMRTQHEPEIPNNDLSDAVKDETFAYHETLRTLQDEISQIPERLKRADSALILVFEGWDAAGKSGCIRRISDALREDRFQIFGTAAPSPEEKSRHYLWRFWRTVPAYGSVAIYDRSWYGRVLVERVENLCTPEEWKRAYTEIHQFERTLHDNHYILRKFWLDISPEEQFRRFEARLHDPIKRKKMSDEDWRNRAHRPLYESALVDMLQNTNLPFAPWIRISAENKKRARLAVLQSVLDAVPD